MKFLMFTMAFSMLVMASASTSLFPSMGASMTDSFYDANTMTPMTQTHAGCASPLCQMNSMGEMSTDECLVHCLAVYSSSFGSNNAVLPVSFTLILSVLAILIFFWPKMFELGSNLDKRLFSNLFNKLLFHRSLATVVIRD